MMQSTILQSPDTLHMIECRLDMLDRILLSNGVGRGERMDIVQSVEDQIHELIDRSTDGEPSRDEVIKVLRGLDPPEAYLAECVGASGQEVWQPTVTPQKDANTISEKQPRSVLAIIAFVLAMMSIPLLILIPIGCAFGFAAATIATVCFSRGHFEKHQGRWMAVTALGVFMFQYVALVVLMFNM